MESALLSAGATTYLPAETLTVGVARDIRTLAQTVGWSDLLSLHPEAQDGLRRRMPAWENVDPLNPADLSKLGIDPNGNGGFMVLPDGTHGLFADVLDAATLDDAIATGAAQIRSGCQIEHVGGAVVTLCLEDRWPFAVVRHDSHVFLIKRWRDPAKVEAHALWIAQTTPAESLAARENFQSTLSELAGGRDLSLFVNFPAISNRSLLSATDGMEDPERVAAIAGLIQGTIGGLNGLAVGASLTPQGVEGAALLAMPDGTLLKALPRNNPATSGLLKVLSPNPNFVIDTAFEPETLEALVRLFASGVNAEKDLDKGLSWLGAAMGIDGNVFQALSGELGFAVDKGDRHSNQTITLGLTDPELAQQIVDRISALAFLSDKVRSTREGIAIEMFDDQTLHVSAIGSTLVGTTNADVLQRAKAAQGVVFQLDTEAASAAASRVNQAGRMVLDFNAFDFVHDNRWVSEKAAPEKAGANASLDARGIIMDINRVNAQIHALEAPKLQARKTSGLALQGALGSVVLSGEMTKSGLLIRGGHYHAAGSAAAWLRDVATRVKALDDWEWSDEDALLGLYSERSALTRRLTELRTAQ